MIQHNVTLDSGRTGWRGPLQENYNGDFQSFVAYAETYCLLPRMGFATAEEAWDANPMIEGSTNPADFGRVQTVIERLETQIANDCTKVNREEAFDNMMDEVYSFEKVGGPFAHMSPSRVLKEMDPVAHRCGVNDYADGEEWVEVDGETYTQNDAEEIKESFVAEIERERDEKAEEVEEKESELRDAQSGGDDGEAGPGEIEDLRRELRELAGELVKLNADLATLNAHSF